MLDMPVVSRSLHGIGISQCFKPIFGNHITCDFVHHTAHSDVISKSRILVANIQRQWPPKKKSHFQKTESQNLGNHMIFCDFENACDFSKSHCDLGWFGFVIQNHPVAIESLYEIRRDNDPDRICFYTCTNAVFWKLMSVPLYVSESEEVIFLFWCSYIMKHHVFFGS